MHIKVKNKLITEPIINILYQIQRELTNGKLKNIDASKKSNILISCPSHKDGMERNPSCRILADTDCPELEAGYAYCFSCGYSHPFVQVVADLFDKDVSFAEEWLIDRYGNTLIEQDVYLPKIEIDTKTEIKHNKILDESILLQYDFYHPYMWQRKLTKAVVDEFRVGYDKTRDAITFPVYDEHRNLVMVTARSVKTKRFWIPSEVDKPVYLLYDLIDKKSDTALVTESQINCLTARTWNYPSIALFGTGSSKQFDILRKSGIRNYILVYDGDEAGRKGAYRFRANMPKDIFITDVLLPAGKDLNDITKDEFDYYYSLS